MLKKNKIIIAWLLIVIIAVTLIYFNFDKRIIALISIVLGWLTNAFIGISIVIGSIPIVGPIIIKLISIPFFWLMNGVGFFSSAYAIKKGETETLITHRLLSIVLVVGIIIGYIIANIT